MSGPPERTQYISGVFTMLPPPHRDLCMLCSDVGGEFPGRRCSLPACAFLHIQMLLLLIGHAYNEIQRLLPAVRVSVLTNK